MTITTTVHLQRHQRGSTANLRERLDFEQHSYALPAAGHVNLRLLTSLAHNKWGTCVPGHSDYNDEVSTLKTMLMNANTHVSQVLTLLNRVMGRAASLHTSAGDDGSPFNNTSLAEMKRCANTLTLFQVRTNLDPRLEECAGFQDRSADPVRVGLHVRAVRGVLDEDLRLAAVQNVTDAERARFVLPDYTPPTGAMGTTPFTAVAAVGPGGTGDLEMVAR